MNNILLPTDFSLASERVYRLAAQIAKSTGSTITICNLIPSWSGGIFNLILKGEFKKQSPDLDSKFESSYRKIKEIIESEVFKGVKVNSEIKLMSPKDWKEKFIKQTDKGDYDLVIIGHNERGEEVLFFTDDLSQKMRTPVLASTKNQLLYENKPILICLDFKKINAEFYNVINMLNKKSEKVFFYINTKENFLTDVQIKSSVDEIMENVRLKNTRLKVVNGLNVINEIQNEVEQLDYQFVALATHHGVVGLKKLFKKSVTESLIDNVDIPVLSVNTQDF